MRRIDWLRVGAVTFALGVLATLMTQAALNAGCGSTAQPSSADRELRSPQSQAAPASTAAPTTAPTGGPAAPVPAETVAPSPTPAAPAPAAKSATPRFLPATKAGPMFEPPPQPQQANPPPRQGSP